ncbi:MAG: HDOD domain-containing protein [Opitutaceae bacterium]|nr:HDOD domain-containing protein [Opitutaceae bacterium]
MSAAFAAIPGSNLTPADIVRAVTHLPSSPKVVPRLKQLLGDGNSSMQDIVALVRLDPGIASRVLVTANSAYFSMGARCTTVEQAVNRVGYDRIYELVSYAVASQVLVRPVATYGVEADDLWKMSVACAIAADLLAEHTLQDRSVAYTIGLLHAVGMVAIDEWALREGKELFLTTAGYPDEATEAERATLGFTQSEVGAALMEHWQFPRGMSEPVRTQYTPRATMAFAKMASLLHAAKWIRSAVCVPSIEQRPPLPEARHLEPLGLQPEELDALAIEVGTRLDAVSSLLDTRGVSKPTGVRHRFPTQDWHRGAADRYVQRA